MTDIKTICYSEQKLKGVNRMPVRMLTEKFYMVEDLVDILPLSKQSIQVYIRTGKLPGRRIGKFYYVSQASLKEFLRGRDERKIEEDERKKRI
ncbi:DNA-binding protein [Candidatus Atribacteria bacterium 1244-E10-H5-B2]|nr:MAG: DNA-binding protein [Candidatus Atribacteria bacterium 1244-E10-H5-B2]